MIIGICGFISSGKDTVADYLVNYHEFRRVSFAGALKDAISCVFGWDRNMLEGRTKTSREWREQPDPWWSQRLGQDITPRGVLQQWGTEVCRAAFHDDIWIASLENQLRTSIDNVVISDCRFPNEVQAIKKQGGMVIWVRRGPLPEWYDCALKENTTHEDDRWILEDHGQLMEQKYPTVHSSEWAWIGTDFDTVLDNDGSIDDLYDRINQIVIKNLESDRRDAM
jgi:hypothetical protein